MADKSGSLATFKGNTSVTSLHDEDVLENDVIDPRLLPALILIIDVVLPIPVLVLGVTTNILNIAVFTLSGQRDSVSIALKALSISDLGYTTSFLACRVLDMLSRVFMVETSIRLGYHNKGIGQYLAFIAYLFQDTSAVITVFVAVQKCCCVAIPLLFNDIFSPRRVFIIIICLTLILASTNVPILAGQLFRRIEFPDMSNKTIISLVWAPFFSTVLPFWFTFNKLIFPAASQVISLICVMVMTIQLKKSAKFRTASADIHAEVNGSSASKKRSSRKMGHKERRAVTALALVSVMYLLASIPLSMWTYYRLIAPGIITDPNLHSLNRLLISAVAFPVHISASVNIFIYLKYNTKFKETAVSLFKRCPCCKGFISDDLKDLMKL